MHPAQASMRVSVVQHFSHVVSRLQTGAMPLLQCMPPVVYWQGQTQVNYPSQSHKQQIRQCSADMIVLDFLAAQFAALA